ncbi:Uncharacterized membrane protein [Natronoarchaeum philippinense]|uniref:Uncharacterized membrane protein n=1 Tax=Natronoarchaeum philippinense TaxID=558529 RepID=A0A285P2F7_NATPI|nr:DUF2270 domain-containing protein [Natronoarchaeum philippinense]SNZ15457.1 Uncharacterized membrane protein [Natronoarchaeum philippinense]
MSGDTDPNNIDPMGVESGAVDGKAETPSGTADGGAASAHDTDPKSPTDFDPAVGRGLLDVDMGPSSALAHLYRGEVHRMKLWRERLDRTTNWAVVLMAAILTWAFGSANNPHYVLLIGNAAVALFLTIEARRYRAYETWRSRVRILQRNVWAPGLDPSSPINDGWRERLAADYRRPTLKIPAEEAISHRLRRVYLPLFGILSGAWLLRVLAFGDAAWPASADIGQIPGEAVTAIVVVFLAATTVVACRPRSWHARGELREEDLRDESATHHADD